MRREVWKERKSPSVFFCPAEKSCLPHSLCMLNRHPARERKKPGRTPKVPKRSSWICLHSLSHTWPRHFVLGSRSSRSCALLRMRLPLTPARFLLPLEMPTLDTPKSTYLLFATFRLPFARLLWFCTRFTLAPLLCTFWKRITSVIPWYKRA